MKWIFDIAGLPEKYSVDSRYHEMTPKEKKRLRWQIAQKFSPTKLPIHACLLTKQEKGVLICGASGSGKSTLASFFVQRGYKLQANDFVVIWKVGKELYGGNLNLENLNQKQQSVQIDDCYFLDPSDSRDIFKYTEKETQEFYARIMKPWKKSIAKPFFSSNLFKNLCKKHIGFGNRSTVERWGQLIERTTTKATFHSVGIIGLGVIGQDIANLLITMPSLEVVNLFSPNQEKVKALALDLRSASTKVKVNVASTVKKCIQSSDILIFSFRSHDTKKITGVQERYARINDHAKIIWQITRAIRETNYHGVILVVSNPVDLLSLFTYHFSNMATIGTYDWHGLCSNQVYGVGLGLDYARLQVVSHKKLEVAGEHGDSQWLGKPEKTDLLTKTGYSNILGKVKLYSESIRKGTERTRFGPSHEVYNIVQNFIHGSKKIMRLSTASGRNGFWGQPVDIDTEKLIPNSVFNLDGKLRTHIQALEKNQRQLLIMLTKKLAQG